MFHAPPAEGVDLELVLRPPAAGGSGGQLRFRVFDGSDGPEHYQVARQADVTVLMWRESKVEVNHAYKGELTEKELLTIVADIPKILAN